MLDRTKLRTADEELAHEFGRIVGLLKIATRKPLFTLLMNEASAKGLNWIEALEYVVDEPFRTQAPKCFPGTERSASSAGEG